MAVVLDDSCISCRTVSGQHQPPGGIVYQNAEWLVCLRRSPLLTPGEGLIILRRHCEELTDLSPAELASLGPTMQLVAARWGQVLGPCRVHFGLYAEQVRHLHLHVLPRTADLPVGNIPVTLLGGWYRLLARVGLRHAYSDGQVAQIAIHLRETL